MIVTKDFEEIVSTTLERALRAKNIAKDFNLTISKWSLEQAICNRMNCSMEKAANDWLRSRIAMAFQTQDITEADLFIENWNI